MKRWWADTLFKRLFALMWVALVVSHLCAFFAVRYWNERHEPAGAGPGPHGHAMSLPPVLTELPPGSLRLPRSLPPAGDHRGPGLRPPTLGEWAPRPSGEFPLDGPPAMFGDGPRDEPPAPPFGAGLERTDGPGLPTEALWLDYAVRLLVIGLAAWTGARWLASPMRKLADASASLGRAIAQRRPAPPLDETDGTLEVQQTAQVFNTMARQLHAQFDAQGLLMAAISHDLRTPLARMRLRLEQMDAADANVARCVGDLREMDALIGNVLGMMRDRHADEASERIDVRSLVQSIADDLAEQGQPVAVETARQAESEPAIVQARPSALRRVIGNLVGNAVRHGGSARLASAVHGREFVLTIDDDGPGIAPHQLDAVFQPFFRADAARGTGTPGSGLGLFIARDLIEREGGRVTLANRPSGGLRATLTLPIA